MRRSWLEHVSATYCALSLLLFLALVPTPPAAADAGPDAHTPQSEVPVLVFNRTIAVLRAPFFGADAVERARRTERNIGDLLARGGAGVVTIQQERQGNLLLVDGTLALILTPEDTDALRRETLAEATRSAAAALKRAIADTREARDQKRRLRAVLLTAVASALLLLAWTLVRRTRTWLVKRLADVLRRNAERVQLAGAKLVQGDELTVLLARRFVDLVSWVILGVFGYEWTSFVLDQFPYTRPWGGQLDGYLLDVVASIASAILHAIPGLLIALLIFLLARGLIAALSPFFTGIENRGLGGWLDRDTAKPTRRLFSAGVWLFAMVMAYPYLPGSSSAAFKGVTVLVGLMVTLGGTSLFGQAASGLILMYSRSLRVGEHVRIDNQEGLVLELATFTTRLRTASGEEVTLSNAEVISAVTTNYSRPVPDEGYIADATVTIGYDTPWRQVEAMLIEAATGTPGVATEPPPRVFKTELTDFFVAYRLICQAVPTAPRPRPELLSELNTKILDVFNAYGVQITSPHYVTDPATQKVVRKDAWFAAPARKPPEDPSNT